MAEKYYFLISTLLFLHFWRCRFGARTLALLNREGTQKWASLPLGGANFVKQRFTNFTLTRARVFDWWNLLLCPPIFNTFHSTHLFLIRLTLSFWCSEPACFYWDPEDQMSKKQITQKMMAYWEWSPSNAKEDIIAVAARLANQKQRLLIYFTCKKI